MQADNYNWDLAERYVEDLLSPAEKTVLENKIATDPVFAASFNEAVNMLLSLKGNSAHSHFKDTLRDIAASSKKTRIISIPAHYLRTAAIAASIAIITSLGTFWLVQHNNKKIASQYVLLRKDLEKYQRSQNQLIRDIKTRQSTPVEPARYTGSGFAITNNGYVITNYHVIEGADSVYILTNDGEYHKSSLVSFNGHTDLALLKVDNKKFRFGKADIPYSLLKSKSDLGSRVYAIGYPEDEMVYYEGYISSMKGYEGDSAQYRLEIPAEQGLSGAPVLNRQGSIIAVITGRKTESQATTYAVNTEAVLELVESLPKTADLKLHKSNKLHGMSREQQVKKLADYTCAIKVYKQ